uniref:Uncharacterized protein n=1 Tax=Arundo donax TaxID=35708 RepID=A0A0A8ZWF8_ARUDO
MTISATRARSPPPRRRFRPVPIVRGRRRADANAKP